MSNEFSVVFISIAPLDADSDLEMCGKLYFLGRSRFIQEFNKLKPVVASQNTFSLQIIFEIKNDVLTVKNLKPIRKPNKLIKQPKNNAKRPKHRPTKLKHMLNKKIPYLSTCI